MSTRFTTYEVMERDGALRKFEMPQGYELDQRVIVIGQAQDGTSVIGWSASLRFGGLIVAIRERVRGTLEAEGDHGVVDKSGKPVSRPRTGTTSRVDAVKWAYEKITAEHTRRRLGGDNQQPVGHLTSGGLTILEMFNIIWAKGLFEHVGASTKSAYERLRDTFLVVFGADKRSFSKEDIRDFYLRRSGHFPNGKKASEKELKRLGITPGIEFPKTMGRRTLKPTKAIKAKQDLKDAFTLFNYLIGVTDASDVRYIVANPLAGLGYGDARKGRKPVPTVARYRAIMKVAVRAMEKHNAHLLASPARRGPTPRQFEQGVLRVLLAIAYHTGQRIDAILHLMLTDFRSTEADMRSAIREAIRNQSAGDELPTEDWAAVWSHGLLYFRKEWCKTDYDRPVPINPVLRKEIERYLEARSKAAIESPWMFFSPNDPTRPMRYEDANTLLRVAEELARVDVVDNGQDPDLIVPDLGDQLWHGYRALWENLRDDLGWFMNKNAAYAGGWTTNIGGPQDAAYRRLKAHYVFAVVCGLSVLEVLQDSGETQRAKDAITVPAE